MRFVKYFFYALLPVILLLMVFTIPTTTRAGAVTTPQKTVNFYQNNQVIFSTNLPYGYTLNDLENANLLENSYFSDTPNITIPIPQNRYSLGNSWFISTSGDDGSTSIEQSINITSNDGYGVTISRDSVSNNYTEIKTFFDFGLNTRYYYYVVSNGQPFFGSATTGNLDDKPSYRTFNLKSYDSASKFFIRFQYGGGNYYVNFGNNTNEPFTIDYCYIGLQDFQGYFNKDFLKLLYQVNSLTFSQSPYTNLNFDFDEPVYFNLDLYYSDLKTFSLNESWQVILTNLDNNFITYDRFINLQNLFKKLLDYSAPEISSFLDILSIFTDIFYLIFNSVKLIFAFATLLIAPFIDLIGIFVALFFTPYPLWFL